MSLAKTVKIKVYENEYTVPFPTTGQFLDIRALKSRLIDEIHGNDALDGYARLLADMTAVYMVLIPELKKNLNADILQLSMVESKVLLDTYTELYLPFFNGWMEILTASKETKASAKAND